MNNYKLYLYDKNNLIRFKNNNLNFNVDKLNAIKKFNKMNNKITVRTKIEEIEHIIKYAYLFKDYFGVNDLEPEKKLLTTMVFAKKSLKI